MTPGTRAVAELIQKYPDVSEMVADITDNQYIVPNEYLFIDGTYGPLKFDETFKSMIFCNNKLKSLELRVSQKQKDGDRILATWCIADMKQEKVYYQSRGESLYLPPKTGWKRVIDDNEWHSDDNNDANITITEKELKSFDSPEFVSMKTLKDSTITIEYDYKRLHIEDAPHCSQWIEITAHNQTHKNTDDIFEIIQLENDIKDDDNNNNNNNNNNDIDNEIYSENKDNDDNNEKQEDAIFKTLKTNMELAAKGDKLQKQDWSRDIFDFTNLGLQQEYKFTIKLANSITFSESVFSESIIPKTLASIGIIDKITCDPQSKILRIDSLYPQKSYNNKSMNPMKLFIKITPWPGNYAFLMNNDDLFNVDEENERIEILHKPISIIDKKLAKYCKFEQLIVTKINLGIEYSINMESQNEIGINKNKKDSDSFKYIPVRKPPKPVIEYVNVDEKQWSMDIHFRAYGFDFKDCRAWFELELIDPNIYNKKRNTTKHKDSLITNDIIGEILSDPDNIDLNDDDDDDNYNDDNKDDMYDPQILSILNKKHTSSPILLQPLCVGQQYILRIKCCNKQGITYSDIHEPIILKVPPPQPIFTRERALDSTVLLKYECPNYNFYRGFQPKFEIKAAPHHKQAAITTQTQVRIDSLRNGWDYSFKVRGKNKFGESDWSNNIRLRPLKKPDEPTNLHTVSGDKCITIFWFSFDNMEEPDVAGRFHVISDPPTTELKAKAKHKVEFQALDNNQFYRFKVFAINKNFKIESDWTVSVKPSANKDKRIYKQEKQLVIDKIMKIRRKKLKDLEKIQLQKRHDKRQENIQRIKNSQKNQKDQEMNYKLSEKEKAQTTIKRGAVSNARNKILRQLSKDNDK